MDRGPPVGGLLLALLCFPAWTPPLGSQAPETRAGAVQGVVFDSTQAAPLAAATVFLWQTDRRAVTDADGAFLIEDVPEGSYDVVFFHARLAGLGISPGSREVVVRPGEPTRVRLAVPSIHAVLAAQCAFERPGEGDAASGRPVVGQVTDAVTGVAYPAAHVHLSWTGEGPLQAGALELVTDERGWFRTCFAPAGVTLHVTATFLGRTPRRKETVLDPEGFGRVDFALGASEPARLSGRLVDAATGRPVSDAEVLLEDTEFRTATDRDGAFRFEGVPPGTHELVARHLAYLPRTETLRLEAGVRASVVVALSGEAIPLEPLEVVVEGRSLTERAMGGFLVSRAEIERVKARARDVADVLREQHLPGLIVRRDRQGPCVGFTTGQVRMTGRSGCVPVIVFINGARVAGLYHGFDIPAEVVDHMVLYRPIEAGNLFGLGSGNGVLQIFTRSR